MNGALLLYYVRKAAALCVWLEWSGPSLLTSPAGSLTSVTSSKAPDFATAGLCMLDQPQRSAKDDHVQELLQKLSLIRDAATASAGLEATAAHLAVNFHAASECTVSCGALMPPAMLVKVRQRALPCAGVQSTHLTALQPLLCSLRRGHQICFVLLVINAPCPAQAFKPHRQPIQEMLLCSLRCGHH